MGCLSVWAAWLLGCGLGCGVWLVAVLGCTCLLIPSPPSFFFLNSDIVRPIMPVWRSQMCAVEVVVSGEGGGWRVVRVEGGGGEGGGWRVEGGGWRVEGGGVEGGEGGRGGTLGAGGGSSPSSSIASSCSSISFVGNSNVLWPLACAKAHRAERVSSHSAATAGQATRRGWTGRSPAQGSTAQ